MKLLLAAAAFLSLSSFGFAQDAKPAPQPASAPAPAAPAKPDAKAMSQKAIAWLRTQQDKATGGWAINPQGPTYPAITGLIINGMLMDPDVKPDDPAVAAGVKFILNNVQSDGGIYDKVLPSYNTSICLTALTRVTPQTPQIKEAIKNAQTFLKSLQYGEGAVARPDLKESAAVVGKDHAFYGGVGYGSHGRPDLSNTAFVLEALHASGVDASDPAFQRALVFLQRLQMVEVKDGVKINDMPYAKGSKQGGFIYATSIDKDKVGVGQSQAKTMIEETLDDGTKASRLRAYGSMTYSGFKSYMYAGLRKDDPRVVAAMDWIRRNYTLDENPGMGTDGQYYYYVVFARALRENREPIIKTIKPDGSSEDRNWADDLIAKLASLQNEDGSFKPMADQPRWLEGDPVLITAYSLMALENARQ